jgi:RND family efflux transporter MFP subunit
MFRHPAQRHTGPRASIPGVFSVVCCLAAGLIGGPAAAAGIEGFTEPYREIDVASAEPGILVSVDVSEGSEVREGQLLAQLDQELLRASLAIADKQKQLRGQLNSARAELEMRRERLEKLQELLRDNHASQEEVSRAAGETAIAEARVLAAEEALEVKELEYDRIQAQLDRCFIRSPVDGVVKRIHKDVGEFVAPTDPVVLTVVQLDPLLAIFAVGSEEVGQVAVGRDVRLRFMTDKAACSGKVTFISPVINAQSATVTVKVQVANPDGRYRSGERCVLLLSSDPVKLSHRP